MALKDSLSRPSPRVTRPRYLAIFLLFAMVAARKLGMYAIYPNFTTAAILLGVFLLLLLSQPRLARRFPWYNPAYFLAQTAVVQTLGLLRPYEDTWAVLYLALAFQLFYNCSLRGTLLWGGLFAASTLITLMYTLDWVFGLGLGLFLVAASIFFVSYDYVYTQSEVARLESQELLAELQAAHSKLQAYAAQAEELAAAQERERLRHELHDSVSQMIFSISLNAQAARLLLDKDPRRVPGQLEQLQELTGQALSQMRALIGQWRPG
ncbi:MAG: histidine kinase dimerization/phosphoacceptor domain-containing protein [Chloroflexota bacterium]